MIWRGYVLSILWRWFIVVPFGAPILTVPQAIGVAIVVSFLISRRASSDKDERPVEEQILEDVFVMFLWPLLALGMGAIVAHFL